MQNKQPASLKTLFLTELWERYGFYTAQGLMILFMANKLGFADSKSYGIVGGFMALAYLTPLMGGAVADKISGYRMAILFGGILLSAGYALLALGDQHLFYVALATIAVGNGFFKPNVSSLVGKLYEKNDPRREAGFTIFYMGINLGVLLATLSAGFIQQKLGWNASFFAASIGLVFGTVTLLADRRLAAIQPTLNDIKLKQIVAVVISSALAIGLASVLLFHFQWLEITLPIGAAVVFVLLLLMAWRYPAAERYRLILLILLILASIFFWSIYWQLFLSVNLFIDRIVDRNVGGTTIPPIMFMSLLAIYVIILGAPVARLWRHLDQKNRNISTPTKFGLSFIFLAAAFSLLALSVAYPNVKQLVSPLWIVIAYLLVTLGELLISPIGLSAVTTLAPEKLVGFMMGVWFFATGIGGEISGLLAQIASIPPGTVAASIRSHHYQHAFIVYSIIAVIFGVIVLSFSKRMNRLM